MAHVKNLKMEHSRARRPFSRWTYASERRELFIGLWTPSGQPEEKYAELSFNMGDAKRTEHIQVCIHPKDFLGLASAMITADKEATIQAFASAILASQS